MKPAEYVYRGKAINLSECNYKGCFWDISKQTFVEFENMLKNDGKDFCYVTWGSSGLYKISFYYQKGFVYGTFGRECFEFSLRQRTYGLVLHLLHLTTDCSLSIIPEHQKSKTKFLLEVLDYLAKMFGVVRVYLQDSAQPLTASNNIDLSLLTVMKESKMFYEKYGYKICDYKPPNLDIHKKMLREFRMDIFKRYLSSKELTFVQQMENKLQKDYLILGEFYTDAYRYLNRIENTKNKKRKGFLQSLLTNTSYPWYAMVNIIQSTKVCMEKWF